MFNLGIFLLIIISITYTAFWLKSATLMLFSFALGILFVVSVCSVILRCSKVRGSLQVPIEISEKGRENLVKVTLHNGTSGILPRVAVVFVVKDAIGGTTKRFLRKISSVPTGESVYVESIVFPEMGRYKIFLKKIRVCDVTGLAYGSVWTRSVANIQVMPGFFQIPVLRTEATKNFYGEADSYDERLPGYDNSEIFQIREYQRGDRLQHVHWKLTAKHDELVVKEHSLPKSCPVVLLLDYEPGLPGGKRKRVSPFLEAAASLSFSMMEVGCPQYIAWYDRAQKDILRVRVDDEESLFYFVGILADIRFGKCGGELAELYRDRYRAETYVREYVLDEKLVLKSGTEIVKKMERRNLEKTLTEMELIL